MPYYRPGSFGVGRTWLLAAGGWKLEAGSWKLETGSWKLIYSPNVAASRAVTWRWTKAHSRAGPRRTLARGRTLARTPYMPGPDGIHPSPMRWRCSARVRSTRRRGFVYRSTLSDPSE